MTRAEQTMTTPPWEAPGPGLWRRDETHFPNVPTRYYGECLIEFVNSIGTREGFRNYGLLIDDFDVRFVGGRPYLRPRPVGAPEKAGGPPPRFIFRLLFLLHPELRYRKKRAGEAFATRLWRQDLARWRNELAPKLRRTMVELQQVDLATLDDTALRMQVEATRQACLEGMRIHFLLHPADTIPVGDWLRHTCAWTGVTPADAMLVLKGKAQAGVAPLALLDQLADAVSSVEASMEILHDSRGDAHSRFERLRASDPQVAKALDTYLDEFGNRLVTGYDLCDQTLRELPHVQLGSIAAQLDKRTVPQDEALTEEAAVQLRNRVPAAARAEERRLLNFEELPLELGDAEAPPPVDLLPPACARVMLGMMFYLTHLNADAARRPQAAQETFFGHGVSGGRYEGRARIVRSAADFEQIESGDVLVTRTTSPGYNVLLPLLGAVVTDRGGALCHTAIVAREFGIPAVVGTEDATVRIPDGARIVVDGDRGVVEILA